MTSPTVVKHQLKVILNAARFGLPDIKLPEELKRVAGDLNVEQAITNLLRGEYDNRLDQPNIVVQEVLNQIEEALS